MIGAAFRLDSCNWLWKNAMVVRRPNRRECNPSYLVSMLGGGDTRYRHESTTTTTASTPPTSTTVRNSVHSVPEDNESKVFDTGDEEDGAEEKLASDLSFMNMDDEYGEMEEEEDDDDETGTGDEKDDDDDLIEEEETGMVSSSGVEIKKNLRQKNIAAGRRQLREQQQKFAAGDEALQHPTGDDDDDDGDDGNDNVIGDDDDDDGGGNHLLDPADEDDVAWKSDEDMVMDLVTSEVPAKPRKRGKYNKELRRGNFVFEAVPLFFDTPKKSNDTEKKEENAHGTRSVAISNLASTTSLADRIVLLDNLPIDITVDELDRLYSRFGPLESIRIFNQRLDLDPGPLSKLQQKERLRRQVSSVGLHNARWRRPCSPVHALITYVESNEGALDEGLCIFGMILHRHPVRSIPGTDLTRLYIENLPSTLFSKDNVVIPVTAIEVEHWLTQHLDPDHYLCLGAGQSYSGLVGSCELQFPNFEHAWQAFAKLDRIDVIQDETNQCRVHWRQTPQNAQMWWTREIGFN